MKINIHIDCLYKNVAPICKFSCTNNTITKTLSQNNNVELEFDLKPNDTLGIDFVNKDDRDDNIVEIKKIIVDGIDLQHFIYYGSFTPRYNTEWYVKQNPKPPTNVSPCTELRHNGIWKIDIRTPIWDMIMKEWLNDKR